MQRTCHARNAKNTQSRGCGGDAPRRYVTQGVKFANALPRSRIASLGSGPRPHGAMGGAGMIIRSRLGAIVFGLFFLSGAAGLVYQSIWAQYLGLLLGHAAYAQTLVLAIFMGGMAVGAWLASRLTPRWKRLFRAYAFVELAIGVLGIAFHPVFVGYSDFMHQSVLPGVGNSTVAHVLQWLGSTLIIAPQSVLLGTTFPLMSAAFIRTEARADGEVLGGLYFSNSIGAALGALLSTFVLLPSVGLPGTVASAGALNVLVAAIALVALGRVASDELPRPAEAPVAGADPLKTGLLVAAFVTGATSFVYEIVWIRMLNQALGTTVHAFELMLTAFITGLAFGGLWVKRRSARMRDPLSAAAGAQILMGIAALVSTVVFAWAFDGSA